MSNKKFQVDVKRASCLDTKYCMKPLCKVVTARRAAYFNFGCDMTKNIENLKIYISLFYRINHAYQQFPIDLTEDWCEYLKYKNPIRTPALCESNADVLLNETSNGLRCLFQAGHYYYIQNLLLYKHVLRDDHSILPNGDY